MADNDTCCILRDPGAVNCYYKERNCKRCGWNPDVEEERKAKIRAMMKEPLVDTYRLGPVSYDKEILA